MSTKTTPKQAVKKPAVKQAVTQAAKKPTPANKTKQPIVKVFEGDVKVKKTKVTVTTDKILTQAHSQVTKLFS